MPQVIYVGDDEIVTPANGGTAPVEPGDILDVDDVTAGALVGYGHGAWRHVDDDGLPVDPVDTTPAPDEPAAAEPADPDTDSGENEETV